MKFINYLYIVEVVCVCHEYEGMTQTRYKMYFTAPTDCNFNEIKECATEQLNAQLCAQCADYFDSWYIDFDTLYASIELERDL